MGSIIHSYYLLVLSLLLLLLITMTFLLSSVMALFLNALPFQFNLINFCQPLIFHFFFDFLSNRNENFLTYRNKTQIKLTYL